MSANPAGFTHVSLVENSATLRAILECVDSPYVALLCDAHNTFIDGKKDPMFTLTEVGKYVRHVHLKDSRSEGNEIRYVMTGRGNVPIKRQVHLLMDHGFRGSYSSEWEKCWHPDIEEPKIAFADYVRVMRQYFVEASDKSSLNINNQQAEEELRCGGRSFLATATSSMWSSPMAGYALDGYMWPGH